MSINMNMGGPSKKTRDELEKKVNEDNRLIDVGTQIKSIDRRYKQMANNFADIDKELNQRDEKWQNSIDESDKKLNELKQTVEEILSKSVNNIKLMEKIIYRFKDAAKKTDHDQTKERLDNWRVEDLITKDRFKKIFLEELEKRV